MNYSIETTETFRKEAKKLIKKYPSLKIELIKLNNNLEQNPFSGIHLGNDIYKIRIAIASKGKGKSGGYRILTQVKVINKKVFLFSIYNKGDIDNLTEAKINELIREIESE